MDLALLTHQISALADHVIEDGEYVVNEISVGPEPGVVLLTTHAGEEFTIIVKEG